MTEHQYTLSAEKAEFYESTFVPALFQVWARRLVSFAAPSPGQRVLDVACGTGVVAREISPHVGEGNVVGLDLNPAMLEVARRLDPQVRWEQGDAAMLPFEDGSFDLVVSQAALMFFPDRVAALREMGRVSTGDVVIQVPGRLSHSAGYTALARAVQRHAGAGAVELLGAYFAVGEPSVLRALFASAGLAVHRFETWTGATRLASVDEFLDVELLPIAEHLDPAARERLSVDAVQELAAFINEHGAIAAPIEVHLVAARGGDR